MNKEINLTFALPEGDHGPVVLSNFVFGAGFEDALVGTGEAGVFAVELTVADDADLHVHELAQKLITALPEGTRLKSKSCASTTIDD